MTSLALIRSFCGAMGNDASWVSVVDVCRGSLVRAQVGARRGMEAILLHIHMPPGVSSQSPSPEQTLGKAQYYIEP